MNERVTDTDVLRGKIKLSLVEDKNGYWDFDVGGLPGIHRVCIPRPIAHGDPFNVYCDGGVKAAAYWAGSALDSLAAFARVHRFQLEAPPVSEASPSVEARVERVERVVSSLEEAFPLLFDLVRGGAEHAIWLKSCSANTVGEFLAQSDMQRELDRLVELVSEIRGAPAPMAEAPPPLSPPSPPTAHDLGVKVILRRMLDRLRRENVQHEQGSSPPPPPGVPCLWVDIKETEALANLLYRLIQLEEHVLRAEQVGMQAGLLRASEIVSALVCVGGHRLLPRYDGDKTGLAYASLFRKMIDNMTTEIGAAEQLLALSKYLDSPGVEKAAADAGVRQEERRPGTIRNHRSRGAS